MEKLHTNCPECGGLYKFYAPEQKYARPFLACRVCGYRPKGKVYIDTVHTKVDYSKCMTKQEYADANGIGKTAVQYLMNHSRIRLVKVGKSELVYNEGV